MAKGRDSVRSNHCSLYIDLLLILKKELFRSLNSQRQGAIWWVLFESYFWINIMVQHTCWVSERKKLDTKKLKTEVIHFYECVIKNKKKRKKTAECEHARGPSCGSWALEIQLADSKDGVIPRQLELYCLINIFCFGWLKILSDYMG